MERKNYGDVSRATETRILFCGDPMKAEVCAEEILLTDYLLPTLAAVRLACST